MSSEETFIIQNTTHHIGHNVPGLCTSKEKMRRRKISCLGSAVCLLLLLSYLKLVVGASSSDSSNTHTTPNNKGRPELAPGSSRQQQNITQPSDSSLSLSVETTRVIKSVVSQVQDWMEEPSRRRSHHCDVNHQCSSSAPTPYPFITLAFAQSLDGCIGIIDQKGKKSSNFAMSGSDSLVLTHALRSCHDGILVGGNTFSIDNPRLSNRLWQTINTQQPRPVILDTYLEHFSTIQKKKVMRVQNPIICCSQTAYEKYTTQKEEDEETGSDNQITFLPCPLTRENRLDLNFLLFQLKSHYGINSIMVEGGGVVLSAFVEANHVDCVCLTIAPKLLGSLGYPAFSGMARQNKVVFENAKLFLLEPDTILLSQWPED